MENQDQKECININFSEGLGIFDDDCGYPVKDEQEKYNGSTGKVKDIQGIQAHAGRDFLVPEGKEFSLDIDECPYLHIAIKAEKDTKTCLFLMVHDKEPNDHKNRFVVIGKTLEGDPGIYDVIADCFTIEDDGQWHEYDLDLRNIREKDEEHPYFPDAGSVSIIEFYSWTGSGEHTFYFNDLVCKPIATASKPFVVKGKVAYADGKPYAGGIVRAFDIDLRRKESLGKAKTNLQGYYEIQYSSEGFSPAEKESANLCVCVVDEKGNKLFSSDILFNAPAEAVINLTLPSEPKRLSEFELLVNVITPRLKDLPLAELNEKDIYFLAKVTGEPRERIALLVAAVKASLETAPSSDLIYESHVNKSDISAIPAIPAEVFYGWFRKGMPIDLKQLWAQSIATLRTALKSAIEENIIPAIFAEQVENIFDRIPHPQRLDLKSLVAHVPMSKTAASAVIRLADDVSSINDDLLGALVAEGSLEKSEAKDLGLTVALHRLGDGRMEIIQSLKDASFNRLNEGGKLHQVHDLIALEPEDWHLALEAGQVAPPEGIDLKSYARELTGRVARLFPTDFLLQRAGHVPDGLNKQLAQVQPLLDKNPEAFSRPFDVLELEGLSAAELKKIRETHSSLSRLANLHPGLELHELLAKDISLTEKVREVEARISLVQKVYQMNPGLDFLSIDYYPDSKDLKTANLEGLGEEEQRMVFADLKAYKRMNSIARDALGARSIIEAGYHSSYAVASINVESFARETGLPLEEAAQAHAAAKERNVIASLNWMAIHNMVGTERMFSNGILAHTPNDYLMRIPGFAELFGNQNYCRCQHCQSVLSPAAYFVDLMKFVEDNVLKTYFSSPNQNHSINLKIRRPDLWILELTCKNTNEVVAHLDIINEVLENFIARELDSLIDIKNRGAVEDKVYGTLASFDRSFRQPFSLPLERLKIYLSHFDLSIYDIARVFSKNEETMARTRLGLSKEVYNLIASITPKTHDYLTDLYTIEVPSSLTKEIDPIQTKIILNATGLSREELGQVLKTKFIQETGVPELKFMVRMSSPGSVQNDIEEVKGLTGNRLDRMHRFVRLWRKLPWTVMELDYLLGVLKGYLFSWDDIPGKDDGRLLEYLEKMYGFDWVRTAKIEKFDDCQTKKIGTIKISTVTKSLWLRLNDEKIKVYLKSYDGTTDEFIAKNENGKLNIYLKGKGLAVGLDADALKQLPSLLNIQERWKLPVEELCALWADIPSQPLSQASSLFDRLFNLAPFVKQDGRWPNATKFTHPAFNPAPAGFSSPDANMLHRLTAGLLVSDEQLAQLVHSLESQLGATSVGKKFEINADNLTLLYRHARLAQLFDLSVPELFQLFELAGLTHVGGLNDLVELIGFRDWQTSCGFTMDEIAFLVEKTVLKPISVPDTGKLTKNLVLGIQQDKALQLPDTVFALIEGIGEDHSRLLVTANSAGSQALEHVPASSMWRVVADFDLSPGSITIPDVIVPENITDATDIQDWKQHVEEEVIALLDEYRPIKVLPPRIASALGLESGRLQQFLTLCGVDTADLLLADELWSDPTLSPPAGLKDLFAKLMKLKLLLRASAFDTVTLDFINLPSSNKVIFGLQSGISIESVKKVSAYVSFVTGPDLAFAPSAPRPDAESIRYILATGLQHVSLDLDKVARGLCIDRARVVAVLPHVVLSLPNGPADRLSALQQLSHCIELANYMGIDGETFNMAISDKYADLKKAAEGFYAAFRTKYPEEKKFFETIEGFDDKLRGRRRDALVDYLLTSPPFREGIDPIGWVFNSIDELSAYFLVDVQLGGCARTSRLVAATSSVQLYVHRVLMNLEQSRDGEMKISPQSIPQDEWMWRKNYRGWEANRKVYLDPEIYIEPELRDDKTPLFKELEDTLLQQEITEQNVIDAYAKYMASFEELAKLKIAGAYHDKNEVNKRDILHLFGVTADDPPIYYYRTIENAYYNAIRPTDRRIIYSPWNKIDVQITSREVSPVVYQGGLYVFWADKISNSNSSFVNGNSVITGYSHRIAVKFSRLRLDQTWTSPQFLSSIYTPEDRAATLVKISQDAMLQGSEWKRIYPSLVVSSQRGQEAGFFLYGMGCEGNVDLDSKLVWTERPVHTSQSGQSTTTQIGPGLIGTELYSGISINALSIHMATGNVISSTGTYYQASELLNPFSTQKPSLSTQLVKFQKAPLAQIINGSVADAIVAIAVDWLRLEHLDSGYRLTRLGTTLAHRLTKRMLTDGLTAILAASYQQSLEEDQPAISELDASVKDATLDPKKQRVLPDGTVLARPIDLQGPYGIYYREIFFQIPFLIANHFNSQQKFSSSQQWYNYIFNPTAPNDLTLRNPNNRVWQYIEFRNLDKQDPQTLFEILTDDGAIEAYRKDPFNPHAIARLRISAYQKSIVMKYIDNLLDWGDSLFTQFTMESVNEATMLYIMASDILGPRPADVGDCGEGNITAKTYEQIALKRKDGKDFLIELEDLETIKNAPYISNKSPHRSNKWTVDYTIDTGKAIGVQRQAISAPISLKAMNHKVISGSIPGLDGQGINGHLPPVTEAGDHGLANPYGWKAVSGSYWTETGGIPLKDLSLGEKFPGVPNPLFDPVKVGDDFDYKVPSIPDKYGLDLSKYQKLHGLDHAGFDIHRDKDIGYIPYVPPSIITSSAVFCIPENKELLAYWDRVEDRLYKVRNCMDISGVRRQLELFAPEIDPRMLVRMKAEGLTLEDILKVTSASIPPYRFTYLIEKAKQFAGTMQSLGSQLLSAMEKRDGEELNHLRTIHEQNLLKLRKQVQEWEIKSAEETMESLKRQQIALEYRRDYYNGLVQNGLSAWEQTQQVSTHLSNAAIVTASLIEGTAGILALIPQVGSPTAMKYGGEELSQSAAYFAGVSRLSAHLAQLVASSAGLEATFQRREDEWKHQSKVIETELKQLEKQITAADFRIQIAERSLEIHQKTIEQTEEVFEFYRGRFASRELYTWLSNNLNHLYRDAFNAALAMARMAERAYHFERNDEDAPIIESSYWEPSKAGLLAADRLILDLQSIERRFIETNYRDMEINQSFSLSQWNPVALIQLREKGSCEFDIPEIFFDLTYPGHYRRKIKAVRLTIPCVTGPYTNVGATLTLNSGQVRIEANLDASFLKGLSPSRADSIAVSKAQYDAGVFEFSFRDERYNHFEEAGAISNWKLSLPQNFRLFEYQTISDVILHIDYTAEEDSSFREKVETNMAILKDGILEYFKDKTLFRVFSLRHDFPSEFHRLMHSPNTEISIKLSEKFFPIFSLGRTIQINSAKLALRTPETQSVSDFEISINSSDQTDFTSDPQLGGLPSKSDLQTLFTAGMQTELKFLITQAGDLAPSSPTIGDASAISSDKLLDMLIYMEYKVMS